MEFNLAPLSDRLPPEGKEDLQIYENVKYYSDESNVNVKFIKDDATLQKSFILSEDTQLNDSEKKFTLQQFLYFCENSNNSKLKILKNNILEKQNLLCKKELQFSNTRSKIEKLSSKRNYTFPLPKPSKCGLEYLKHLNEEIDAALLEEFKINQNTDNSSTQYARFSSYNDEIINKIFKCRLCHNSDEAKSCWLLLSPSCIYVLMNLCHTEAPFRKYIYEDINLVLYDSSYHWLTIAEKVCRTDVQYNQINIGDSDTTKLILGYIELYARRSLSASKGNCNQNHCITLRKSDRKKLLTHQWRISAPKRPLPSFRQSVTGTIAVQKWLLSIGRLKKNECHQKDWLVLWQNGNHENDELNMVHSPMEGHLMTRKNGFWSLWKPAYFLLKDGQLYEFSDASDSLPSQIVDMKTCRGCTKLKKPSRPHSLQILRRDEPSLLIAAPDNYTAEQWLEALQSVIFNPQMDKLQKTKESQIVSCQLLLTESRLLLLQHNFDYLLNYVVYESNPSSPSEPNKKCITQPYSCKYVKYSDTSATTVHESSQRSVTSTKLQSTLQSCQHSLVSQTYPIEKCIVKPNSSGIPVKVVGCPKENTTSTLLGDDHDIARLDLATEKTCTENHNPTYAAILPVCSKSGPDFRRNNLEKECRRQSKVLSSGNLDQISCIFLISECSTSCVIEFECSEALDMFGDWVVHFRTHEELSIFLDSVKEYNVQITLQIENLSETACRKRQNYFLRQSEMAQLTWKAD